MRLSCLQLPVDYVRLIITTIAGWRYNFTSITSLNAVLPLSYVNSCHKAFHMGTLLGQGPNLPSACYSMWLARILIDRNTLGGIQGISMMKKTGMFCHCWGYVQCKYPHNSPCLYDLDFAGFLHILQQARLLTIKRASIPLLLRVWFRTIVYFWLWTITFQIIHQELMMHGRHNVMRKKRSCARLIFTFCSGGFFPFVPACLNQNYLQLTLKWR